MLSFLVEIETTLLDNPEEGVNEEHKNRGMRGRPIYRARLPQRWIVFSRATKLFWNQA